MIPARPTSDEPRRLEALRRYAVLDTLPEQALDDLAALAAHICGTPIALISLVDKDRQWFKSRIGMAMPQTARDISFCGHAVHQRDLFIVPDATQDERFVGNPLVTGEPHICFYAGAPLVSPEDTALGALCVIDHVPRCLTAPQEQALRVLARQVMTHLELRRRMVELVESEDRLRIVTEHSHIGLVIIDRDRRYAYANQTYAELLELSSPALIGLRVPDVLAEIYTEQIAPRLDRAFAGERVTYELRKPTPAGERHYLIRYEPTVAAGAVPLVVVVVVDITEQKRLDEQLRGRTAFLEAQVNSAPDGIIIVDRDGRTILQNSRMVDLWKFPKQIGEQTDNQTRLAWVVQQVRNPGQFTEKIAELYSHREQISRDEIELLDGRIFDRYTAPVLGPDGAYYGRIWSFRDVTERQQAEVTARRLAAIIEFSDDAIISKTLGGVITSWNPAAERVFGYTAPEIIGQPITRLFPPDRLAEEIEIQARIAKGDRVEHFETVRVRKDGRQLSVSATISPIKDASGNVIGISKIVRDITERKRSEEQIAEQASLLDKARDAIVVRDLEGRILFWNQGAGRMYGWTRQEVAGRSVRDFLYTDPKKFEEVNRQTIERGEWHGEIQHLTKGRSEITIEARWTLILDAAGQPKSVLAINTDITDRKKIEGQFMRAQRMESIGTLAGGIAHDLNNILTPIMMSIDILKSMFADPQAGPILAAIENSSKRGAEIVRQVLSFARGLDGQRIEVQPKHLLRELEGIIKNTFPKNIRVQVHLPNRPWTILGDPTQVHQILLNLCVNARDAMPHGGTLTVSVENVVVDEQYAAMQLQAKAGRYVLVNVTDTGTGIPPGILDKIFEPFFTTKDPTKGTGLGLSTVMAIVKSHSGFVNVYSEPGKGTTFKVCLPAMAASSEARKEQLADVSLPRGKGETVLVIDDEASILVITGQTLREFGYQVMTATDGADALAVYLQHRDKIAVVLTDMMMPVMDGAATIHALLRINPAIKIIATSGLKGNDRAEKPSGIGVRHFLMKPYSAGTLLKALRTILDQA